MIRKYRTPEPALLDSSTRPGTTLLAGLDDEGPYWAVARRSGYRDIPWSILHEDGRMIVGAP